MANNNERAERHKAIWRIANDLRGSVDGWDFKTYVLGMLFYRFISENLTSYDPSATATKRFFAAVQNKLHYAIHGQTAAEVILDRADHQKDNMGLTRWEGAPHGKIHKYDVSIAKNYHSAFEMAQMQRRGIGEMAKKKDSPGWSDVKAKLTGFDRVGLTALVQDLYAASKDNQAFLNARLGLGDDPLKSYKATISRWVCPDVMRNQDISVAKAKKAIADYKKAIGRPEGLAELSVYYCEEVFTFLGYCGMDDEGYYSALVRMFEQALKATMALPEPQRDDFLDRLEDVRVAGQGYGWGVGDDFNWLWQKAGLEIDP